MLRGENVHYQPRQCSPFACRRSIVCGKNASSHNSIELGMCGGGRGVVKVWLYSNSVCLWALLLVQPTLSSSTVHTILLVTTETCKSTAFVRAYVRTYIGAYTRTYVRTW